MLASMRKTASSVFVKALMLLLVLSFAVWGVGDMLRGGSSTSLATVGDAVVAYPQFSRRVEMTERSLQAMGMGQVDGALIRQQVLRQLVEEQMIAQRLHAMGLEVSDATLAAALRAMPVFHDVRGRFSGERFRTLLQQQQMTEKQFLSDLTSDIRTAVFSATMDAGQITPPIALASLYEAGNQEQRTAYVVTIPVAAVKTPTPDSKELQAYYARHKEQLYMTPERRTLEYVTFSVRDLRAMIESGLSDDRLRARYEAEPERFTKEDGALQSFAEAKSAIRDLLRQELTESAAHDITIRVEDALAAGDSMGEAIARAGLPARSHLLKDITADQFAQSGDMLVRSVAGQGFGMEQGDTSSVQTTPEGAYYMVSVRSITPATPKPFDAVAADVRRRTLAQARAQAVRSRAAEVAEALAADDWRQKITAFGLRGREVGGIHRPQVKSTPGIAPLLAEAVFEHAVGEVAGPLAEADGDAMVARILTRRLPSVAPRPGNATLKQLAAEMQQEVAARYYEGLMREYPVRLNERLLQQISAREGDGA